MNGINRYRIDKLRSDKRLLSFRQSSNFIKWSNPPVFNEEYIQSLSDNHMKDFFTRHPDIWNKMMDGLGDNMKQFYY